MTRAFVSAPRLGRVGPATRLGRWCTPTYSMSCDPERKIDLNNADHSVQTSHMREALQSHGRRARRPSADTDADECPWSNPLAVVFFGNGFGV